VGRVYSVLECGCHVSCDGGGGLIPCTYEDANPDCKFEEWNKLHRTCPLCCECSICYCNCTFEDLVDGYNVVLANYIASSKELQEILIIMKDKIGEN